MDELTKAIRAPKNDSLFCFLLLHLAVVLCTGRNRETACHSLDNMAIIYRSRWN